MSSVSGAKTTSLWLDQVGRPKLRDPLDGSLQADVAIVGGGYSGLWTAYYLTELDPSLDIVVVEKHFCGFGASGRNGGWCVGELAGPFERYAERSSPAGALALARATFDAVDEIGRVVDAEGIECGFAKGGTIRVARNRAQADRQRSENDEVRAQGFTEDEIRLLDRSEATKHLGATKVESGIFLAPSAALHPSRLVRGLAETIEGRGVTIVEGTAATGIDHGVVITERGRVNAGAVVRATEAYTRDLEGERRALLPVYSLMVATEPLDTSLFDEIGLGDRQTFADDRHMVIYGQRTADDRIAFGGRGVPYLFGSRIARSAELHEPSHQLIADTLGDLLPPVAGAAITHRWGGVLGIPRNWLPSVTFDRVTSLGTLGGYVGEGVAASNLAGRTMAELIVGKDSERVTLPWVGVTSRRWEPEPARWLGVRASRRILAMADDREATSGSEAGLALRLARLLRGD